MPGSLAGEQLFLLAELALTVRRVDWAQLCGELPVASVRQRVQQSLDLMDTLCGQLEKAQDVAPIQSYARAVFEEVKK